MDRKNVVFALGSHDPEMRSIRYMLCQKGYRYTYANRFGRRCITSNAYSADQLSKNIRDDQQIIWVECRTPLFALGRDLVVDHHNPGDPGYDAPPSQFWLGSSIGQVAELIGASGDEYALVAASDHCLSAAMRGECPGISRQDLMCWRITARAAMADIQPWLLRRRIDYAVECLQSLPRLNFGGEEIVDATFVKTPELRDAAAVLCLPVLTTRKNAIGQIKVGLYGARPEIVTSWLDVMGRSNDVDYTYGCPLREYGGAVLSMEASNAMVDFSRSRCLR
ncbi:hypothetical protein ACI77O_12870 [Pseudomonas tritici]|uniref:hypothetical protein n=1 Tax=Pseudomonas tritici TaxID=2745518 RepID=UPI00387B5551